MTDDSTTGWVKLYTPEGALVTVPLGLGRVLETWEADRLLTSIKNMIEAGFSVTEPGLDEGELKLDAAYVARRTSSNENTPVIDFYSPHPKAEKKVIHKYMNTAEDIAEFEAACGIKLSAIPEWEGDLAIAKNNPKAGKYIVPLKHPVSIIYTVNRKWQEWNALDPDTRPKKEPMKKILSRYEHNGNGSTAPQATGKTGELKQPPMPFAAACEVLTPNGSKFSTLTPEQLKQIVGSTSEKVTPEMRNAAKVVLKEKFPQER